MGPYTGLLAANYVSPIFYVAILVLIVLSAFFSASETAYSTSSLIRIRNMADENVKGARRALLICENYDRTLSTILVGNNLVNIANTTLAAYLFSQLIADATLANLLNTVIMTLLILIFGEVLPKSFAKSRPEKLALSFANTMHIISIILWPIAVIFTKMQHALLKKKNGEVSDPTVTEDELETIIDTMEEEGVINSEDATLIQGVLDLGETTAYDIMTPRVDVSAIEINDDNEKIKQVFEETYFSRLPVYEGDVDHIIGYISQKNFFPAYIKDNKFDIKSILSEIIFISENTKVDDIIRQMQKAKKHIAVVSDEHGGTSGIVCMEDALEEMVGEIYDEHDDETEEDTFEMIEDNTYIVDAEYELEKLFDTLNISKLPDTEYNTVGGFVYELSESVAEVDKEYTYTTIEEKPDKNGNYIERAIKIIFKYLEVEDNRAIKIKVTVNYATPVHKKID
ncbi:MAG: HlyC/CorC family transporter [Clostridiales bacterium]|nr:HlyC/CorC family transporter [Clostridiales bacterium]